MTFVDKRLVIPSRGISYFWSLVFFLIMVHPRKASSR